MVETTRRDFLKITGMATVAGMVPITVLGSKSIAALPNLSSFTLTGLQPGSSIGIFEAATMKQIFVGRAESDTVSIDYAPVVPTDVIIRVRKAQNKSVQFTAYAGEKTEIPVFQPEDRLYG